MWHWQFFTEDEMRCKCGCGASLMSDGFMNILDRIRRTYGRAMIVTSAYRCPTHNNQISTTGMDGPHTTGRAVDIKVSGTLAVDLVRISIGLGMKGFGFKQHGPHESRFIHFDDIRQRMWSYP